MDRICLICKKQLSGAQRKYCSTKCRNRGGTAGKYGLTVEEYELLTKEGRCCICFRRVRRWHLDHLHGNNLLQGAVCAICNTKLLTAIRRAENPLEAAQRLVDYIANPPAQQFGREIKVKGAIAHRKSRYVRR